MIKKIILWRHGQTDLNKQLRLQGSSDYPLNDTGRTQAAEAAKKLAALKPTAIVSSDLTRAIDTAKALEAETGLEMQIDARLQERSFGSWEGMTVDEIAIIDEDRLKMWRAGQEPSGDVETRQACGNRFAESVVEWSERFTSEDDEILVIVSHGGAISSGVMTLLGIDPSQNQPIAGMKNCHWAVLEPQPNRTPVWRLTDYNIT